MNDEDKSQKDWAANWKQGPAAAHWPATVTDDFLDDAESKELAALTLLRVLLCQADEMDRSLENETLTKALQEVFDEHDLTRADGMNFGNFLTEVEAEIKARLIDLAGRAIDRLLRAAVCSQNPFTASQVYRALPPEMHFRGQIGRAVSALDRAGLIEVAGVARAGFPANSGRPAIVWIASQ